MFMEDESWKGFSFSKAVWAVVVWIPSAFYRPPHLKHESNPTEHTSTDAEGDDIFVFFYN